MALNPFKKEQKKEEPKKVEGKPAAKRSKAAVKERAPQAVEPETQTKASKASAVGQLGGSQLVRPHITEKATDLATKNQYVFVVQPGATKKDIEKSVEKAYGVHVQAVRVVNVHPKHMRLGRTKGIKKGYKKAIVQLQEGQSIEILPT